MRLRTIGAAAAGALALALADCRQVAGVQELAAASAVCASCADAQCATEETACRAGVPACSGRIACELACDPDDLACRASCAAMPVGDAVAPFDSCAESACESACAGSCGDVLPVVPPASAAACAACVAASCCDAAGACAANAECRAGIECARAVSELDAVNTCQGARHPSGAAAGVALDACVKASCADPCAYGADWSCLGAEQRLVPTADTITSVLTIVDANAQGTGIPGLQVRACAINDEQCIAQPPLTPTLTTDANGSVMITVSTKAQSGRNGFLGYYEVVDPNGTYLTTVAIPGLTVTQTGIAQSFVATTRAGAQALAQALNRTFDAQFGYALVTLADCAEHPGAGSSFAVDNGGSATEIAYPFDGIPSLTTTHTDETGVAVLGFLPPGSGVITATNALGQIASKTSYFTRAGALSIVLLPVNQ